MAYSFNILRSVSWCMSSFQVALSFKHWVNISNNCISDFIDISTSFLFFFTYNLNQHGCYGMLIHLISLSCMNCQIVLFCFVFCSAFRKQVKCCHNTYLYLAGLLILLGIAGIIFIYLLKYDESYPHKTDVSFIFPYVRFQFEWFKVLIIDNQFQFTEK